MPLRFAKAPEEYHRVPLTIRHLLDGVVAKAGDRKIVYRDQVSYGYPTFVDRVGRLASLLKQLGTEPGTTVAMMDWDSHRYLESYFAVPMMGAVLQTVNVRLAPSQIAYTLKHAGAEILFVHRDFLALAQDMLAELPAVRAVIAIMDGEDATPAWVTGEYEELSASASPDFPFEDFDEDAIATTFYTTGTTGDPKGVCFSHRQLVLHTLALCGPFGASAAMPSIGWGDVYMPLTPMFHAHAWGFPYVATMLALPQVYPGRYEPARILDMRREHGVSYSHCVPTVLEMLLREADRTTSDLSGWKMTIGGSALTQGLCVEGRRRGMEIAAAYGMSETCPVVLAAAVPGESGQTEEQVVDAATMSGLSLPLVEFRIVDEDMTPLPHDSTTRGELVLRAPWLTPGYTGNPVASTELWRGGWMHTNDVATVDCAGNVRIRDRLKDVIKTGGEWIDSLQLEELVASAGGIEEAAVVAVPDALWGERPLAVVVPLADITPTLAAINEPVERAIANGAISRYARLDRFEKIDALPRTSVGKIDKKALRARFAGAG